MQDWRRGITSLYGKIGGKRSFDMDGRKPIDEDTEDDYESSEEGSSTTTDLDSDSTSSSEEDMEVAFLLLEEDQSGEAIVATIDREEDDQMGPYEVIEELMQPRVELAQKQDLVAKMLSIDLSTMEKEKYLYMLFKYPNLFITSYEEIRGFKGENLHIEIKEGQSQ